MRAHPAHIHPPRKKGTPAAKGICAHPPVPACPRPPPPPFAGSPLPQRRRRPHPRRGTRLPAGRARLHFPRNVPKLNPPSLKPRTAGQPPSRVGAAPTARPPRVRSPSLPGLARRLRSAAHSSSGRRHVRPGAGAPARPAQPPVPRGPIPPPLSAWGGGSPPELLPARAGSGRDGAGWHRGRTRSRPAADATGEAGGGDGEVAPRRRGDAPDGADPPPPPWARDGVPPPPRASRSPGSSGYRTASVRPEGRLSQPAMPVRGSGRQRCPCEAPLESSQGGRGRQISPQQPPVTVPKSTHAHHSPEPGKPRSHKASKPERKARPWPGKQK